jgi:hypothetical protein
MEERYDCRLAAATVPLFPKPRYVPVDVDGRDLLGIEKGDGAEIEETVQVGRVVLVRVLGGRGLEQDRCRFS